MTTTSRTKAKSGGIHNPNLLDDLRKEMNPSYSSLGKSLDFSRGAHKEESDADAVIGGAAVQSYGAGMSRKERERQLQRQSNQQKAWDVAETKELQIPTLPTMAPSFTKAADEGVEALGGTKLGRPGYVSVIGLVPTVETVQCIEDDFELISSFRPYQHDARRAAREAAMREKAAPHPDLLSHFRPTLAGVSPMTLIDVGALPLHIFDVNNRGEAEEGELGDGEAAAEVESLLRVEHMKHIPPEGTYPFINQGRGKIRKRLPGQRQPVLGQYFPRFKEVERRVTHGYMKPLAETLPRRVQPEDSPLLTPVQEKDTRPESVAHYAESVADSFGRPGGNISLTTDVKGPVGSWMFASNTYRQPELQTAAPDVYYWPYPDIRSTTKRAVCQVNFKECNSHRRRDLQVSGVPAGVYDVVQDVGANMRDLTQMATKTGRENHWFTKSDLRVHPSSVELDVDEALKATRPHVAAALLPPREVPPTPSEAKTKAGKTDNTVSIERDPNFPATNIGTAEKLNHVRAFEHMISRDGLPQFISPAVQLNYDPNHSIVERRGRSAHIHRRAPAHGTLHNPHPTEIGETPNLKWVKPNHGRTTEFGVGTVRPHNLLPFRDLSYNVEPCYPHVEPRVCGNPMIGTTTNRNQREKLSSTRGCGAEKMYDGVGFKDKVKLVPLFEKQITKETQFCGPRIPSERWERKNPKAPGPGFYDVKYTLVE